MRYAIVCIGNIDIDCNSWLAGVTSDRSLAIDLAGKANQDYSHEHQFDVFVIPDDDFIGETLKGYVKKGEDVVKWRAEYDAARKKAALADRAAARSSGSL